MHFRRPAALIGALVLMLAACTAGTGQPAVTAIAPPDPLAAPQAGEWPSDGRDYSAQRYSPLTQISAANVSGLGLAWYDDLDTYRGVEATPIYSGGVLYNSLPLKIVKAYDARTGRILWTYDPE